MGGVEFIARVVSNRMQKTVVVAVTYVVWIPKYKVYQRRVSRHKARDESQAAVIGDIVRIRKSRKYSKEVSYAVAETLRKASVYDAQAASSYIARHDASRPADWVAATETRLTDVQARLAKLREMYEQEVGSAVPLSGGALAYANSGPGGTGSFTGARDQEATVTGAGAAEGSAGK